MLLLVSAFPSSGIFGDSRPIETGTGDDVPVPEDPEVNVLDALRDEIATLETAGFAGSLERVVDAALASGRPVFLYFYAEWCYYCQQERPIVDALEAMFVDAVVVIRVDGERNPEAMRAFDVEGFPTMLVIYGRTGAGYKHLTYSGFTEQAGLEDVLHAVVNGEFSLPEGVGADSSGSCTQPYTHHSCSFGKCYEDCILEQFYPSDPIAKALQAGKVQQAITDFLQACAGAKAAKALQTIYDGVKNTKCGLQCAQADKTGEPRDIGECTRCMIAGTAGKIPGAGCVIELWNTLGDLLVPHSDCIAECAAPPQTWSKNWGHPCRPKRSPDRYQCVGPSARGKYVCIDCEWYLVKASVEECPIYAPQCVSTPSGPRCVDQCEKLNCDDGDPCTIDWCHSKEGCKHDRKPGCDHPDDNEDASDPVFTAAELIYEDPEIAVLSNGFSPYLVSQLNQYNASSGLIDVSLQGLANYSVLLVPSGGLSGLDTSPTVRSRLDAFVREGGTLIVFAQQHGYEYQALPGGWLRAYGWLEDQSCQHASVFISDYHPIFAGQSAATLNVNVDGFFTESPANSTVLLSRTKNAMPAMVLYSHGRGRVLASTLYSDMAISLYQATRDEKALLRDLIAWATAPGAVPSYTPGAVRVPIEVFNPLVGPITYPVSEFASGALVALPVNVTNAGNVTSDAVAFALFDPRYALTWVNVSATIPVNQSALVDLTYPTSGISPRGIWSLFYLLSAGGEATHAGWGGEFALNYSLADLSQLQGFVTVYDPDGRVVSTVENVSLTVPPGRFGTLNATLSVSTPGIWTVRYSVLAADGRVVTSMSQAFAVSVFQESEAGLAYQGSPISLTITSDHEQYAAGSNASFTFHLWNHGDDTATVTTVWSLPHNYWMMQQEEYGAPGTTNPGYYTTTLRATHTVPAHGNVSFDYFVPVYDTDRLWAQFYLGDEPSTSYLGLETRGFFVFTPGILVTPDLVKPRYLRSEVAQLNVTLQNVQRWSYNATVRVWVLDADNAKIYDTSFTTLLPLGSVDVVSLNFTVPPTAHPGSASVFAEVTSRGKRIGYGAAYFEILSLPLRVLFDQATYRVRENLGHSAQPSTSRSLTSPSPRSVSWRRTPGKRRRCCTASPSQPVCTPGNTRYALQSSRRT
jgi:thiol-disulfide isomerase/thioredoxin